MARATLYSDFLAFERDNSLLPHGARVLAAVSGGPDSVALLDVLRQFSANGRITLFACHLNHQLRGAEADEDEAFVARLCGSMGVPLESARRDVRAFAKEKGLSIETAAREARYTLFNRICRHLGCRVVATAHTMSDNAETVLQRLVEGAGPEGLTAIPVRRKLGKWTDIEVVRPLLFATRARIEAYLAERGLEYRIDSTNLEPVYLRNRIRLEVLPKLKELNPSIEEALARVAESVSDMYDLVLDQTSRAWRRVVTGDRGQMLMLSRGGLVRVHRAVASEIVKELLLRAGVAERNLKAAHVHAVLALGQSRKPSGRLALPDGIEVRRNYDDILIAKADFFAPPQEETEDFEEMLEINDGVRLPSGGTISTASFMRHDAEMLMEGADGRTDPNSEIIDRDAVEGPLRVRFARPGDRFQPLGAPGERKLSDFFIDEKVPADERASVPLVVDDEGIVWVVGHRIADRVSIDDLAARLLQLMYFPPKKP